MNNGKVNTFSQTYNIIMLIEENPIIKKVLVCLNGRQDSPIASFLYKDLKMELLSSKIQQYFHVKMDPPRVFTQEGVEIFEEDFQYLKNNALIYVSCGEDFDQLSSFSIYHIEKFLGEGGFGKVLLGKNKISKEQVAIKIIDTYKIGNAQDIDMVFREAELMKSLVHKNIVKIYNCYTLPNMQVVIVMEYLQGGELLQYLEKRGRLSEKETKVIFRQIVDAVSYCHCQKLIHRDLKLENILLTTDQNVKICDFGIAGLATNFNVDKIDIGSLSYMAPELLTGKAMKIGPAIDIWAMGVILYSLLCGNLPFSKHNTGDTVKAIIDGKYMLPGQVVLSLEVRDLLSRMLEVDEIRRIRIFDIQLHPWLNDQPLADEISEKKNRTSSPVRMRDSMKVNFRNSIKLRQVTEIQQIVTSQKKTMRCGTQSNFSNNNNNNNNNNSPEISTFQMKQVESDTETNHDTRSNPKKKKFLKKDYSSVLQKYKSTSKSLRINLNPYKQELERQDPKKRKKKPLATHASSKDIHSPHNWSIQQQSLRNLISNQAKPNMKAISYTRMAKSFVSKLNISSQTRSSNRQRCQYDRIRQLLNKETFLEDEKINQKAVIKTLQDENSQRWQKKAKQMAPLIQYQLQTNFMQSKKHMEEVFKKEFRSCVRLSPEFY